jgi:hypothetical protein
VHPNWNTGEVEIWMAKPGRSGLERDARWPCWSLVSYDVLGAIEHGFPREAYSHRGGDTTANHHNFLCRRNCKFENCRDGISERSGQRRCKMSPPTECHEEQIGCWEELSVCRTLPLNGPGINGEGSGDHRPQCARVITPWPGQVCQGPGGFWPTPQNGGVLAVLDKARLTESISMEAFDSLEKVFGMSHTSPRLDLEGNDERQQSRIQINSELIFHRLFPVTDLNPEFYSILRILRHDLHFSVRSSGICRVSCRKRSNPQVRR